MFYTAGFRKSWAVRIVGLIVGSILLLEVCFRVFFYEQLKTRAYPDIYEEDSLLYYRYKANVIGRLNIPSIEKTFSLNNQGFPGDDFEVKKPEGVFRIAFVGNSITEGFWLQGTSFVEILQARFNKSGSKIEVLNCAMGGSTESLKHCVLIQNEVLKFSPDLIVANIKTPFLNDNESRITYKNFALTYEYGSEKSKQKAMKFVDSFEESALIKLYDISFIVRALCRKYSLSNDSFDAFYLRQYIQRRYDSPDIIHYFFSLDTSLNILQDLKSKVNQCGAKLVLFEFGETEIYQDSLKKHGFDVISIGLSQEKKFQHKYDGHLNQEAHAIIADRLTRELLTRIPKQ